MDGLVQEQTEDKLRDIQSFNPFRARLLSKTSSQCQVYYMAENNGYQFEIA